MKIKPEILFIIFAFVFGLFIMIFTPPGYVLDEWPHSVRARQVANGILYNKPTQDFETDYSNNSAYGYSPVMYIFPAMGIRFSNFCVVNHIISYSKKKIANIYLKTLKDESKYWLNKTSYVLLGILNNSSFYMGRLFNLIGWTLLIALAISITPVFKWAFFMIALTPSSLYQGMSVSADSFSNAFAFLFFAYIFKLIYGSKEFKIKKDFPLLLMFGGIGALCKGVIFQLFLVPLINIKHHKWLIFIVALSFSLIIGYFWSSNNQIAVRPDAYIDVNKNFIIYCPFMYLKLFLKTLYISVSGWILGVTTLIPYIKSNQIFMKLYILIFLANLYFIPTKAKLNQKLTALLTLLLYVFMTSTCMYLIFTKADSKYIEGIQGRYFISILPLLFIIFSPVKNIIIKYKDMFIRLTANYTALMLIYTIIQLMMNFKQVYYL